MELCIFIAVIVAVIISFIILMPLQFWLTIAVVLGIFAFSILGSRVLYRMTTRGMKKEGPSDKEMLDWLQKKTKGYGDGWVCRNSSTGRGMRLHETTVVMEDHGAEELYGGGSGVKPTVREAIVDAMERDS